MIMNFIPKIKSNISIYSSKKTTNILDGSYKSIYKGRTMNFEDLRTYVVGDNVKDIDWKASSRSNSLLVRQFIAEKKHNIMFVFDTGKKVLADSLKDEIKKDVMIMSAGTIAYLANKNGDYIGTIYNKNNQIQFFPFKSGIHNIERILSNYDNDVTKTIDSNIQKSLEYIEKNIKRRMILFILTDLDGMERIEEDTLKRLSLLHDILLINISDAEISGNLVYDIDNEEYFPKIILEDKKLNELERKIKQDVYNQCIEKLAKYRISAVTIDSSRDSVIKIIELLERHRNANNR